MQAFIGPSESESERYQVAERFVRWLKNRILLEARGDEAFSSPVDPTGRYWLGRLGPKDFVTLADERQDRLEPCAIGVRLRPEMPGPWCFKISVKFCLWRRYRNEKDADLRWSWRKTESIRLSVLVQVADQAGDQIFAKNEIAHALSTLEAGDLSGEVRVRKVGRGDGVKSLEITFVNTSSENKEFSDGRFFEAELAVEDFSRRSFELESLPDSFRFDRRVDAYGINCGVVVEGDKVCTSDSPEALRHRPEFWTVADAKPDLTFSSLSKNPTNSVQQLLDSFERWAANEWSDETLLERAKIERWSSPMKEEAFRAKAEFRNEVGRIRHGLSLLKANASLLTAFKLMNRAMELSARGKYQEWRPFQLAFLIANLESLVNLKQESDVVDIVWFATGGGKTETYLGLLLTAAFFDRIRGKISGITAWSRFPLRMLSLQQTQRFANAIAAAEIIRRELALAGDEFALGFLVGGTATPNRIKKESDNQNEDADKIEERVNPFKLLDVCPFCRRSGVTTKLDRVLWRLTHNCAGEDCPQKGKPLPIYVVDDEIWRFLPTIVIGTLDKAANISRQTGMRGLFGSPAGYCTKPGHGYTYATRSTFPNGCLVPDCTGGTPGPLPICEDLFAPTFRLQDELHLLRDSLGAVDAHYECAMDGIQEQLGASRSKILASSATLSGYAKQVEVLYRRTARVFPQPPPVDGRGFWSSHSKRIMRQYIALAPRRLTVEFVTDRLIVTLQSSIRRLLTDSHAICQELGIDESYSEFLINIYGTNVVYGNTLQDIDAVVRSSETQYAELTPPPNVETLTGRTNFEDVRKTLERLENPEINFEDRLHLIAASSMMSHGVDIDRLNIMIMLALPLGVAEFIQATSRVGRKWPALVLVIPKMTRERDSSVYRAFPQFITHGDRFVEPIPITRKSRRVLERTISGLQLARINLLHEPSFGNRITTIKALNDFVRANPDILLHDEESIAAHLGLGAEDEFMRNQLHLWFEGFSRNLKSPPSDSRFVADLSPTGKPMTSLRDVEEQAPIKGDSTR